VVAYDVVFGSNSLTYDLLASNRYDLPWRITGIRVVFSKPINTADVNSLSGLSTTGLSGLGTNTLTWTINPVTQGTFATNILGSGPDAIKDSAGNGLVGGGFSENFKVLYGDFTGDGNVSSADFLGVYQAIAQGYHIFADLDGDGVISLTDVQIARKQIGTHL
jgi:hypothetical protein